MPFDYLCSNKQAGGGIFILAVYFVCRQTVFPVWHPHNFNINKIQNLKLVLKS